MTPGASPCSFLRDEQDAQRRLGEVTSDVI